MFKGKCIIFSAPSGSGKTTLVKHLELRAKRRYDELLLTRDSMIYA